MSAGSTYQSLPSSSTFDYVEKKSKIHKSPSQARKKATYRLAARKVKWAKRTVTQRDIRIQIDKEFDETVNLNRDQVKRLQSQNETLRKITAEIIDKCTSLLTASLHSEILAAVPGGESPDFSDSDSDLFLQPISIPYYKAEKTHIL